MTTPRRSPRPLLPGLSLSLVLTAALSSCDPSKQLPTLPGALMPGAPTACGVQTPGSAVCATPAPSAQPDEALPKAMISPTRKGTVATDLTLVDVDGKSHKLSEYKGKFIVLTVFAYWCPHCHRQLPRLENEVAPKLAGKNVVFLGVEGSQGTPEQIKDMAKTIHTTQSLYANPGNLVEKAFMPDGFPTMYLISPEFKIHGFVAGEVDSASLAEAIEKRLNVNPTQDQDWPPIEQAGT